MGRWSRELLGVQMVRLLCSEGRPPYSFMTSLTARVMAPLLMPNISRSSSHFPLRGTPLTASLRTMMLRSSATAAMTASPIPPTIESSHVTTIPLTIESSHVTIIPPTIESSHVTIIPPTIESSHVTIIPPTIESSHVIIIPPTIESSHVTIIPP